MRTRTLQTDHIALRIIGVVLSVTLLSILARHDQIDDALIYARYIGNALHGHGLVFNEGEHVNALSSPFYSYLVLAAAKVLNGRVLLATALISSFFLLLTCILAESLIPFAGLLLASTGYFYSLVGMESSTFLFLLLLSLVLVQRGLYLWLPTVSILLLLTRFESGAFLLPLGIQLYRLRRGPSPSAFIPAGLIASIYLGLNHYWYGAFLPASAGAKLGQGRSGYWGPWPSAFFRTAYQLKPEFYSTFYVVVVVLFFAIPGILRLANAGWSSFNRIVIPFLGILLAFYVLWNIPGYKWYYAPFICFAMIYACAALPVSSIWKWLTVLVLLSSWFTAAHRFYSLPEPSTTQGYTGIAHWLLRNAPPTARIEAGEIGTLGFYCQDRYLMDILGLTMPKNADHVAHGDSRSWLAEDRPDYIIVHFAPWVFEDIAKQSHDYERVPVDFGNVVYLLRRKDAKTPQV